MNTRPPTSPPQTTLSRRTSRGFAWMLAQTLGSKAVGIIGQIFLARLLTPVDFGLVALAYTAAAPASMIRQTGIPTILIQKGSRFDRWANAAFWMDMALGAAAAITLLATAPVGAMLFRSPALVDLLGVIASGALFNAAMTVPQAKMTRDLRFRELASIGLGYNVLAMAISVGLAFMGFGAYSFVIPLPICLGMRALVLWKLAPIKLRWNIQMHRWRAMAGDSGRLLGTSIFSTLQGMSVFTMLGLFRPKAVVGEFSFVANLSSQILQLLSVNFSSVLFPVLSTLKDDPPRQTAAFFRSARALALMGMPVCVAEAVLAKPAIAVIFGAKWLPAVPVLQLLALATAINIVGSATINLMQAQGRFGLTLKWAAASAALNTGLVVLAAWLQGAVLVAAAMLIGTLAIVPAQILSATLKRGGSPGSVLRIYLPPLLCSAIALTPTGLLELWVPWFDSYHLATLAIGAATAPVIYLPLVWHFCPGDVDELLSHAGPLGRRLRGKQE